MTLILSLAIAIAFSAFFSGIEIAFLSSNKLRFEMERSDKLSMRMLATFYHHPNNFITTMLAGNKLALVAYGLLMMILVERCMGDMLTNPIALLLLCILLSTLIMILAGEFVPKVLFKIDPRFTLRLFACPAFICYIILYPFGRMAIVLSTCLLRLVGIRINKEESEQTFTKVDLGHLIQSSIDESTDDKEIEPEVQIFQNVLDFSSIKLRDCLIPRTEIVAVDIETSIEELKGTFIRDGISKVIVYKENIDNIIGYIHSSEMFKSASDWQTHIRTIPIVPDTMGAQKLMKLFMQEKKSLAVVVDEFGGTEGIVALEDLMEELLGDIEDEHDNNSTIAKRIGKDEYILSARVEIERANEELGLDLPEDDEYQTVGGLLLHAFQRFPKVNESIEIDKFKFKIIKVTATKIELVKLKVQK